MAYNIQVREGFLTDLFSLPRELQRRMERVQAELRDTPTDHHGGNIKKLKGFRTLWRYRLGDFRLIYSVRGNDVELIAVGPRRNIYDRLHYNPDQPDEAAAARYEAMLYPDSAAAKQTAVADAWTQYAKDQITKAEEQIDPPLPERLTPERLEALQVPSGYWPSLQACRTERELNRLIDSLPNAEAWAVRLYDALWPKTIEAIAEQPVRLVHSEADLTRFVEGEISLEHFLLKLDEQQAALVGWALDGPTLVRGGPGSGKSTVAMYRARALLEQARDRGQAGMRLLFTTYTNALVHFTRNLLNQLLSDFAGAWEVQTVDGLARALVQAADGPPGQMADQNAWRAALREARARYKPDFGNALENALAAGVLNNYDDDYLQEEFEWVIEGRGLATLADYLQADRTGRGQAFNDRTRRVVWGCYQFVRQWLAHKRYTTWGQLRQRAVALAQAGDGPRWDFVVIDEAQDLTPIALRLCVELCRDPRRLFLAADASQSIYNRGFSYSQVHEKLNVAHRTRWLRRNYRSTREIMAAAVEVLAGTGAGDDETLVQTCVHYGPKPVLARAPTHEAQISTIVDHIRRYMRSLNLKAGAAAILCPTEELGKEAAALCSQLGLPARFMRGRDLQLRGPDVKVITIHLAKGLEFPIVAVPFLDDGTLPKPLPPGSCTDPEKHEHQQRRLLFVALTRAMRCLILTTSGSGQESVFVQAFTERAWEMQ